MAHLVQGDQSSQQPVWQCFLWTIDWCFILFHIISFSFHSISKAMLNVVGCRWVLLILVNVSRCMLGRLFWKCRLTHCDTKSFWPCLLRRQEWISDALSLPGYEDYNKLAKSSDLEISWPQPTCKASGIAATMSTTNIARRIATSHFWPQQSSSIAATNSLCTCRKDGISLSPKQCARCRGYGSSSRPCVVWANLYIFLNHVDL